MGLGGDFDHRAHRDHGNHAEGTRREPLRRVRLGRAIAPAEPQEPACDSLAQLDFVVPSGTEESGCESSTSAAALITGTSTRYESLRWLAYGGLRIEHRLAGPLCDLRELRVSLPLLSTATLDLGRRVRVGSRALIASGDRGQKSKRDHDAADVILDDQHRLEESPLI